MRIRVCNLKKGEVFCMSNRMYKVTLITDTSIIYRPVNEFFDLMDSPYEFGIKSQRFVELVN